MNLQEELAERKGELHARGVADYIGDDPVRFDELIELFFGPNNRVTQYAAHVLSHCTDAHKEMIKPYIGRMIKNLLNDPEVAIKRNTVRILQDQFIPEEYQGILADKCFHYLTSAKEAIAVKAFSMTILANLAVIYPDLKNELKLIIEELMPNGSAGIKSRGRKVLKHLDSIQ